MRGPRQQRQRFCLERHALEAENFLELARGSAVAVSASD
jgi:hypothetical protein